MSACLLILRKWFMWFLAVLIKTIHPEVTTSRLLHFLVRCTKTNPLSYCFPAVSKWIPLIRLYPCSMCWWIVEEAHIYYRYNNTVFAVQHIFIMTLTAELNKCILQLIHSKYLWVINREGKPVHISHVLDLQVKLSFWINPGSVWTRQVLTCLNYFLLQITKFEIDPFIYTWRFANLHNFYLDLQNTRT